MGEILILELKTSGLEMVNIRVRGMLEDLRQRKCVLFCSEQLEFPLHILFHQGELPTDQDSPQTL